MFQITEINHKKLGFIFYINFLPYNFSQKKNLKYNLLSPDHKAIGLKNVFYSLHFILDLDSYGNDKLNRIYTSKDYSTFFTGLHFVHL